MSKNETPMTRWYWQTIGGTLIEEFIAVERTSKCGRRVLDGIIIKNGDFKIAKQGEISLEGMDIIVIQTKAKRLGMALIGQAFFSAKLVERFKPRSVLSVALCSQDDSVLRPLFEQFPNMKVVISSRPHKFLSRKKGGDEMGFTTYKNIANPHVTIHRNGCNQIKKHGGQHKHGQGSYEYHETYADARTFAESTHLPMRDCFFCKPK